MYFGAVVVLDGWPRGEGVVVRYEKQFWPRVCSLGFLRPFCDTVLVIGKVG